MIKHSHQTEHNLISKPTRFSCLLCLKFGLTHKWQVCQWDFSVLIKVTPKPSFLDFSFWFVFRLIHAFSSPWPSFGSLTFALGGAAAPGQLSRPQHTSHCTCCCTLHTKLTLQTALLPNSLMLLGVLPPFSLHISIRVNICWIMFYKKLYKYTVAFLAMFRAVCIALTQTDYNSGPT